MGRGPSKKGIEARQRILAELARRYLEFEEAPTFLQLADVTGIKGGNLQGHVAILRTEGLIHARTLWITRSGYKAVYPD